MPLRLHALAHDGAGVVVGHHLRQQTIAQAEWQIAEAAQFAELHQFREYHRPSDDDLGAAGANSRHRASLRQVSLAQGFQLRSDCGPGHGLRLALVIAAQLGESREGRGCSRSRDSDLQLGVDDSLPDTRHFTLNDTAHLFQLRAPRRVVMQEGLGESHRAYGQADHVCDVSGDGKRQLTAPTAQIDQQGAPLGNARGRQHAQVD